MESFPKVWAGLFGFDENTVCASAAFHITEKDLCTEYLSSDSEQWLGESVVKSSFGIFKSKDKDNKHSQLLSTRSRLCKQSVAHHLVL